MISKIQAHFRQKLSLDAGGFVYLEFLPLRLQGENPFDRDVPWFSLWPVSAFACVSVMSLKTGAWPGGVG